MKKLTKGALAAALVVGALMATPAYALFGVGDIVIDPSNLVQNTSSALAAVRNEVNTATALIHQIQATINLAKSLKSVKGLSNLAGLQQELATYQQLKGASSQIAGLMDQSLRLSKGLESQYGASGQSWQDFVATRSASNKLASQAMVNQYQAIDDSMAQVAVRRQAIVNQLQNSEGQTAALQAVGAGIDTLIGQNQLLLSTLVAQGKLAQKNQGDDSASRQKGIDAFSARQQRMIDADKPFQ
ncbi:hypothetical protein LPN04_31490 [Rugamonas sp. A1-17]|nr:hypothetical protein [Rugamonas sp. A1-17]